MAGVRFDVRTDFSEMLRDFDDVRRKLAPTAASRALNTVGRNTESVAVGRLSDITNVQKSKLRWHYDREGKRTQKRRLVKRNARKNDLVVFWYWTPRNKRPGVPYITLGATPVPRKVDSKNDTPERRRRRKNRQKGPGGVRVQGLGFIEGAFINAPGNQPGNTQVFRRTGGGRYPIEVLRVEFLEVADNVFRKRIRENGKRWTKEFERQMGILLDKRGA